MPSLAVVGVRSRRDARFRSVLTDAIRVQKKKRIDAAYTEDPPPKRTGSKRAPATETFKVALSQEQLYALVAAAVPKNLPPITRDDIICDMVLAVLDGQLAVGDLRARAKEFVREHWRMFGTLRDLSLDALMFDDGGATRGDRVSGHGADYW